MREAFAGGANARRAAFRALLGDNRIRVYADPDPERIFRVEGVLQVPLETRIARRPDGTTGRLDFQVAGVRYETNDSRARFRSSSPPSS